MFLSLLLSLSLQEQISSMPLDQSIDIDELMQIDISKISTEQLHPATQTLSQTFSQDRRQALEQLRTVDRAVEGGYEQYMQKYHPAVSKRFAESDRIFMVGCGSSGRIAIDLAAKSGSDKVIGIIAGGGSTFVRAKEGFEDSQEAGRKAIRAKDVTAKDTVVLISASGSAQFNIGAGLEARERGAEVFYFLNSSHVPERTRPLFDQHGVKPVTIDIGAQAIGGSTRLQAATLDELCIGTALQHQKLDISKVNQSVDRQLQNIQELGDLAFETFASEKANFRRVKDETDQGYVTLLATADCIREVMVDATETAPTFSTNPPARTCEPAHRRAEFRAYMVSGKQDIDAWQDMLGCELDATEKKDVAEISLSTARNPSVGSFTNRPIGRGNMVVMVLANPDEIKTMLPYAIAAKTPGAKLGLITLGQGDYSELARYCDAHVAYPDIDNDSMHLARAMMLKQTLNLVSNYAMVGMGKVYGNRMIDLSASNNKLRVRSAGLVKKLLAEHGVTGLADRDVMEMVVRAAAYKKQQAEKGRYVPSTIKLVLTMIEQGVKAEKAVETLQLAGENLEKIRRTA
ncbi:MAG: hypothetical protein ACPGXY_01030 [Alphaproteobacteria bacterium]